MTRTFLPVLALALAAGLPAAAQSNYVSGFAGAAFQQDSTFTGTVTPPGGTQSVDTDFDTGFGLGLAYGRDFGAFGSSRLRGEVELSYSGSDVDSIAFSGNGPAGEINVDGDISTTRLFGNLLVDFDTGGAFTPYLGAGLGVARVDADLSYGAGVRLDDRDTAFSAQLIAGTSYALSDSLSLTGDVRYIRDFGVELQRFAPTGALTGTVEDDIDTVAVNVGLRFRF